MNSFNFKSAVCTSRKQSERLLALGLKPETADMSSDGWNDPVVSWGMEWSKEVIESGRLPAWSLHRLLSMLPDNAPRMFWILDGANISIEWDNDGTDFFPHKGNMYDGLIDCIEWLIKEGYFKKEYLV